VSVAYHNAASVATEAMLTSLRTFMSIAQPTIATRLLVITIQGVAYNVFFLVYMFFPNFAHRFVGALEEEAVRT
jgi:ubiquinol oxidase